MRRLLVGGHFSSIGGTSRTLVARLGADGSVDPAFSVALDVNGNGSVFAIALQQDGKAILGGDFSDAGSALYAKNLVRLSEPEPALQRLVLDGPRIAWNRGGSAPALITIPFGGTAGQPVHAAGRGNSLFFPFLRENGTWASPPLPLPVAHFRIRAIGGTSGGLHGGSTGSVDAERLFHRADAIFGNGFEAG